MSVSSELLCLCPFDHSASSLISQILQARSHFWTCSSCFSWLENFLYISEYLKPLLASNLSPNVTSPIRPILTIYSHCKSHTPDRPHFHYPAPFFSLYHTSPSKTLCNILVAMIGFPHWKASFTRAGTVVSFCPAVSSELKTVLYTRYISY